MKRLKILMAASLLLALFVTGCSDQIQEVTQAPAPQSKFVANTTTHYSLIPDNNQSVYSAEVIEYTDGSVEVIRSVIPYDGNQSYVHVAVSNNVSMTHSSQGTEFDFSAGDGWYVPFDPGVQAVRVTGRVIRVDCRCDNGASGCNVDIIVDQATNKVDIGCLADQNCTGNCRATLTYSTYELAGDGGILINASEVIAP